MAAKPLNATEQRRLSDQRGCFAFLLLHLAVSNANLITADALLTRTRATSKTKKKKEKRERKIQTPSTQRGCRLTGSLLSLSPGSAVSGQVGSAVGVAQGLSHGLSHMVDNGESPGKRGQRAALPLHRVPGGCPAHLVPPAGEGTFCRAAPKARRPRGKKHEPLPSCTDSKPKGLSFLHVLW